MEGNTARLQADGATRFCQDAGARRERSSGGNGGRLGAALWGGGEMKNGVMKASAGAGLKWRATAAASGQPRRVASATASRRRVADTRRQDSASVGHNVTEVFLKTAIQSSIVPTDRACSTIIIS